MRNLQVAVLGFTLVCGACTGPSIDPARFASVLPSPVELDEDQRRAVANGTEAAVAAWRLGDHIAAAREAGHALDIDPRAPRALAVQAAARHRRGRAEYPPTLSRIRHAEGEIRQATQLAPGDAFIALQHAKMLAAEGHLTAAIARLEEHRQRMSSEPQASEADDNDTTAALQFLSTLHYDVGNDREALPLLLAVASADGIPVEDLATTAYQIARTRFRLAETSSLEGASSDQISKAWQEAVASFEIYRQRYPEDPAGYLGEAQALISSPVAADAERDHARILGLLDQADAVLAPSGDSGGDPQLRPGTSLAAAQFGKAVYLSSLGRVDAARVALEAAVARDPRHAGSWLNLAANQASVGFVEAACVSCRRALELDLAPSERVRVQAFLRANG